MILLTVTTVAFMVEWSLVVTGLLAAHNSAWTAAVGCFLLAALLVGGLAAAACWALGTRKGPTSSPAKLPPA